MRRARPRQLKLTAAGCLFCSVFVFLLPAAAGRAASGSGDPTTYIGTVGVYKLSTGTPLTQHPAVLKTGGDYSFISIHWTNWGTARTTGRGLYQAAGEPSSQVTFFASELEQCSGKRVYTRLVESDGRPTTIPFDGRYCRFKF